ncbi:hypothetical protein [Bradyrhizobium sp. BR 1432]|uniref:hypothetical protein n=1 Tax=Bradyrhizobium sp. BR 1432 TaxID=3447966 RepID=UPI003EE6A73F
MLNVALNDIESASHIRAFSTEVVKHGKQLRIMADRAMFLQKAAADFQLRFMARFEEDIRTGTSWGYATTCNVSREGPHALRIHLQMLHFPTRTISISIRSSKCRD